MKAVAVIGLVTLAALVGYFMGLAGRAGGDASASFSASQVEAPALAAGVASVASDQGGRNGTTGGLPPLHSRQDPSSVIEDELEALRRGDVSAVASYIVFDPEAKALMESVVSSAPAELVHQYPTAELLTAFIFCGAQRIDGFRIESTTFPQPDVANLRIAYKFASESRWRTDGMRLVRMPDGWRRVIGMGEARRVAAIIGYRKQ